MLGGDQLPEGRLSLLASAHGEPAPPLLPPPPLPSGSRRERPERASRQEAQEDPPAAARQQWVPEEVDRGAAEPLVQQAEARWLAFLFAETSFLLVFQLTAGLLSGSLALLADCGHSGADTISYGINYFVERQKAAASVRSATRWSSTSVAAAVSRADLVGCGVSTVLLVLATWLATREAVSRLRATSNDRGSPAGGAEFKGIGPALLAFAVVSTVANVGTLVIYRRWCVNGGPPARLRNREKVGSLVRTPDHNGKNRTLNLCGDFAGMAPGTSPSSDTPQCRDSCCRDGDGENSASTWNSLLHMLVHPGCTSHAGCGKASSGDDAEGTKPAEANLNVTAAMLHLWADVLRGIAILVAAVLIEARLVEDPERADAVCALLVAIFVAMGSMALLQRMWVAVRRVVRPFSSQQCEMWTRSSD